MRFAKKPNGVRWGKLIEIKHVNSVSRNNRVWKELPTRLKHLTAWRRMHLLPGGKNAHTSVKRYGRSKGYDPSSNLPLNRKAGSKLDYIKKHEQKHIANRLSTQAPGNAPTKNLPSA